MAEAIIFYWKDVFAQFFPINDVVTWDSSDPPDVTIAKNHLASPLLE